MDLLNMSYGQTNLVETLQAVGVELDGKLIKPFVLDQHVITDESGNIEAFIEENPMGGVMVTDENTNVIGNTMPHPVEGIGVYDSTFNKVSSIHENSIGGTNVLGTDGNVELWSTENIFGGENYYNNDMELLGISKDQLNHLNMEGFFEASDFKVDDIDFPNLDSLFSSFEDVTDVSAIGTSIFDLRGNPDISEVFFDLF